MTTTVNVMVPQLTLEAATAIAPVKELGSALPREVHLKISKEFLDEVFPGENCERPGILHVFDVLYSNIKRVYKYKYGVDVVLIGNYRTRDGYECFSLYQNGAVDEMYRHSYDGNYYQRFTKRDDKVVGNIKSMTDDVRLVHMDFVPKEKYLKGVKKQEVRAQREAEGKPVPKEPKEFYRMIPRPTKEQAEAIMDEMAQKFADEVLAYCLERYKGDPKNAPTIIYVGKDSRL